MAVFWGSILWDAFLFSIEIISQSIGGLFYAVLLVVMVALWIYREEGWIAVKRHLFAKAGEFVAIAVLAWIPFFLASLVGEIYTKWETEHEATLRLSNQLKEREQTITAQKENIQALETKLKEQPRVIYREKQTPVVTDTGSRHLTKVQMTRLRGCFPNCL
jgi:hypothetical protein